ncbi:MAG: M3 family metallopeptidase [Bacteroidales bacterium]|nr:M3 family metallopeptidase [Bacteroidales bacterium]
MKIMKQIMAAAVAIATCGCGPEKPANPLLSEFDTPHGIAPFSEITIGDYREGMLLGMEEQKAEIDAIVNNSDAPTFENTIVALDQCGKLLRKVRGTFSPLSSSNSTEDMRALQKEMSPLFSAHNDDIYLNEKLFARVKAVYDSRESLTLTPEQAKILENIYKRFVNSGANLTEEQKRRLREINKELSMLQLTFSQNLLHETNNTFVVAESIEELKGLPQANIDAAAKMAADNGQPGKWMFNMQRPSCNPVLQYCENRDLREKVYKAYYNRGNQGNEYDSKEVCAKIVTLRLEKAKLMGYSNYAQMAIEERMAKTPEAVYALLDQVWAPAVAKAKEELDDIRAEIRKEGHSFEPAGWDYMYYLDKAKKAKFAVDEQEIRNYMEESNVMKGIFYVANKLYGITFKEITADVPQYEPTAKAYEVIDRDGTTLAIFYSDNFPRESKRAGAWCTSFRPQSYENGKRIIPIVVNSCNMTAATDNTPALQSIDNVKTMFHEFGHALHNFMRDVQYSSASGVERDFVELPSQINEHWALEPEVLAIYAKHYRTGEVIPMELVEKIQESDKYGQGFATVEYIAASYSDMDLHVLTEIPEGLNVMDFEAEKLAERGIPSQILPRYRMTNFSHTMGGGYTAGYYSYMWAEVLDADAFDAFKETGDIFNPEVAEKFRKYVLTPGGIDDGMTMYMNFRGREPKIDALLRNRGMQ